MHDLILPAFSESMEQGIVLKWLVADGDVVAAEDEVAEIETDKAVVTVVADRAGAIRPVVSEGAVVAVGEVLATVGDPGSSTSPADTSSDSTSAVAGDGASPAPASPAPASPAPAPDRAAVAAPPPGTGASHPVRATPLARRAAQHHQVDLAALVGTGPGRRVTHGDVLRAVGVEVAPRVLPARPPTSTPTAASASTPRSGSAPGTEPDETDAERGASTRRELTRLQQVVAWRMTEAKATIPHFQVQAEVGVDALLAFRAQLAAADPEAAPTINDLLVKASGLALRAHPLANGSYRDDAFVLHERVNVGFAVAHDEALLVPTLFDVDTASLGAIAVRTRELVAKIRADRIAPADLSGGTFTVSNLGMFGMSAIFPVLNAPQAAILGVGASRRVPAFDDAGGVVARTVMTLTLSCDHRILYGADAARFLQSICAVIDQPLRLAL